MKKKHKGVQFTEFDRKRLDDISTIANIPLPTGELHYLVDYIYPDASII